MALSTLVLLVSLISLSVRLRDDSFELIDALSRKLCRLSMTPIARLLWLLPVAVLPLRLASSSETLEGVGVTGVAGATLEAVWMLVVEQPLRPP